VFALSFAVFNYAKSAEPILPSSQWKWYMPKGLDIPDAMQIGQQKRPAKTEPVFLDAAKTLRITSSRNSQQPSVLRQP
jgi:hypothetical protein